MSQSEYPIVNNYLFFKELGTDCIGVDYRAGELNMKERKSVKHNIVTEVYPFLAQNPNVWKRINILLEGVRKSNIPKLYSPEKIIHEKDRTFLVYPMLKGRTFEQVLDDSFEKDNPINFDLAFSIAFSIADLIDVGSSIVVSGEKSFHGFLTPDNIIIDYDGKIYLKNYGIFPYLSREETIFNEVVKKYGAWIAPEFLRKEKLVCQTDIYHLGYIIYKILTGKYFSCSPEEDFDAKFSNISFSQHIPSSDKDFLTDIIYFFKKTLNPVPSQRFANIKEFKDFISNKFHIEELSSVTFNLAYFMNSIYLESLDAESKEMEKEIAYVIPQEKPKPKPAAKTDGPGGDHLVKDIMAGLDEHERKSSKSKLLLPLIAVVVIAIAIGIYFMINQQKIAKEAAAKLKQDQEAAQLLVAKQMKDLEDEYKKRLKVIEDTAAKTEEEKKAQEDQIAQLSEWKAEEARKAKERQKAEEDRLAKIQKDAEDLKKQKDAEAEKEKLRLAQEQKLKDDAEKEKKRQQQEAIEKEKKRTKTGQLISITLADKKPTKLKGKPPIFNYQVRKKYRGNKWDVRAILLIDENGSIAIVRVLTTTLPEDLKKHIIKVIQKWKYTPAEKDGVKVKVWQPVAITLKF